MDYNDKGLRKAWIGGAGSAAVALVVVAVILGSRRSEEIRDTWARHGVETIGEVISVEKRSEFRYNTRRRWCEDVLIVKVAFDGQTAEIRRSPKLPIDPGEKIRLRYLRTDPIGSVGWISK